MQTLMELKQFVLLGCSAIYTVIVTPFFSLAKFLGFLKIKAFDAELSGKIAIVTGANTGL
jgi:hypothetical protein